MLGAPGDLLEPLKKTIFHMSVNTVANTSRAFINYLWGHSDTYDMPD